MFNSETGVGGYFLHTTMQDLVKPTLKGSNPSSSHLCNIVYKCIVQVERLLVDKVITWSVTLPNVDSNILAMCQLLILAE